MRILSIESSAKAASAAVSDGSVLIAHTYQNNGLTHSMSLLPMIDSMLKNSEIPLESIDAIAAAAGPGSFTGLRIGISAAKGLAWGRDIPCIAVSSLESMAWQMTLAEGTIIAVMDARRNQFYTAIFSSRNGKVSRMTEDMAISAEELERDVFAAKGKKYLVGDGSRLCFDIFGNKFDDIYMPPANLHFQSAAGVALAAIKKAEKGEFCSSEELVPVYLRLSQAERERLEKMKNKQ